MANICKSSLYLSLLWILLNPLTDCHAMNAIHQVVPSQFIPNSLDGSLSDPALYLNSDEPSIKDVIAEGTLRDMNPLKSLWQSAFMTFTNPNAVKLMTDGIAFEFREKTYRLFAGWGKNIHLFPYSTFFENIPSYINQLEKHYEKHSHLTRELTKMVSVYDWLNREANGLVIITDETGEKVLGSTRITHFDKHQPLFGGSAQGLRFFNHNGMEHYVGRGGFWSKLFLELSSGFVPKERIFTEDQVEQYNRKMAALKEEAGMLNIQLNIELEELARSEKKRHEVLPIYLHQFNAIPKIPVSAADDIEHEFEFLDNRSFGKERSTYFKGFNANFWKYQEQVFALAYQGNETAMKLMKVLMEMYPDNWFNVAEVGRFTMDPALGNVGFGPLFTGLAYLVAQMENPEDIVMYSEVSGTANKKSNFKDYYSEEQRVVEILASLGMNIVDVSSENTIDLAYFLRGNTLTFYEKLVAYLSGEPWVTNVLDLYPKVKKSGRTKPRVIQLDELQKKIKYKDWTFTSIPTQTAF